MESKLKYETIQEYLELYLYPSLQLSITGLINEIRKDGFYEDLEKEFNQMFFENKALIVQKEKELLKLERGSDYSESDYEYFMRKKFILNDSSVEQDEEKELLDVEEFDPDLDDSEMLHLVEQELNKSEEESETKFNPIDFIAGYLKSNNLLRQRNDFDEVYDNNNEKFELN
jgi:hypothetical protein